ncbi:hypothetical protein [Neobacillus bataviensis]|uniref:hypothetical protein n=1 Tax=Neobacillus bataviensis TaxID=220685 RepID=UPI001CBCA4E6|nr:hypothetical protein [Neobacillus bataviensis]
MSIGIWSYFTLLLLTIFAVGSAYYKSRNSLIFILFFAVSGVTMFFDYLIYVWGKAYTYHSGIVNNRYDTHLGAIVNGLVLSSFAVLYSARNGKWYWSIILAGLFAGIELLFTEWGVYKPNWWKIGYTFSILIFYFPVIKVWWGRLNNTPGKWLTYGTLFSLYFAIYVQLNILLYGLLQTKTFHVEWVERLNRDSAAINSINALVFSLMLALIGIMNARQFWNFIMMAVFIVYYFVLKTSGIIQTDHLVMDFILSFLAFFIPLVFVRYASSKVYSHS